MKKRAYLAFKTQCILHSYTQTIPNKVVAAMNIAAIEEEIGDGKEVTLELQKDLERLVAHDVDDVPTDESTGNHSSMDLASSGKVGSSNGSIRSTTGGGGTGASFAAYGTVTKDGISSLPPLSVSSTERKAQYTTINYNNSSSNNSTSVTRATTVVTKTATAANHSSTSSSSTNVYRNNATSVRDDALGGGHSSPFRTGENRKITPVVGEESRAVLTISEPGVCGNALPPVISFRCFNDKEEVEKPLGGAANSDLTAPLIVFVMDVPGVLAPYSSFSLLRDQKLQVLEEFCSENIFNSAEWWQVRSTLSDDHLTSTSEWGANQSVGEIRNSNTISAKPRIRSVVRSTSFFSLNPLSPSSLESPSAGGSNARRNFLQKVHQFHDIIMNAANNDAGIQSTYSKAKNEEFKNHAVNSELSKLLLEHFSELIRNTPIGSTVPSKSSYIRDLECLLFRHMCKRTGLSTKVFGDVKEFLDAVEKSGQPGSRMRGRKGSSGDTAVAEEEDKVCGAKDSGGVVSQDTNSEKASTLKAFNNKNILGGRKCVLVLYSNLVEDELRLFLSNTNLGDLTQYFVLYIHTSFAGSKLLPRSYSKIRTHLTEVFNTSNFHMVFITPSLTEASGAEASGDVDLSFLSLRPGNEWISLDTFVAVSVPFMVSLKQISHPEEPIDFKALANDVKDT